MSFGSATLKMPGLVGRSASSNSISLDEGAGSSRAIGMSSTESDMKRSVGGAGGIPIVESGLAATSAAGSGADAPDGAEWYDGRGGAAGGCGAGGTEPGGND